MAHVSRTLPERPHIDIPKREARELLKKWRAADPTAFDRVRKRHPDFKSPDPVAMSGRLFRLADAQLVIAREYNFSTWAELKRRIESNPVSLELAGAIHSADAEMVTRILHEHPHLLHLPVRSRNWGPPMSHAANLGHLEIVQLIAKAGAKDHQHAFERALLQGRLACARWLHANGAELKPGILMGPCETLNAAGFRFLVELGAPLVDARENRLAPVAMVLETYSRHPQGKHEILELMAANGLDLPDSPMMAFHRGRVDLLAARIDRDPQLVEKRFTYREIYPPELGCRDDGLSGLHGTPVDGTTLLHMAIDFDEREIFDFLLSRGADVNARAAVDPDGNGGHTPLFNAVVSDACLCGRQRDGAMGRALLDRGASTGIRVNLRKFLDWVDTPHWHEVRGVTAVEWGRTFPDPNWVNQKLLRDLCESP